MTSGHAGGRSESSLAWLPLLGVFAAAALLLGVTVAALAAASGLFSTAEAIVQPEAPVTRRCPECGFIESRRDMPAGTDNLALRTQEYTVRMVDGSSHVFTGSPGERWRLGERLKVIGAM
jgi:hypothetical protein